MGEIISLRKYQDWKQKKRESTIYKETLMLFLSPSPLKCQKHWTNRG